MESGKTTAARAGYGRIVIWAPEHGADLQRLDRLGGGLAVSVVIARNDVEWRTQLLAAGSAAVTVIGPGTVVAPALLATAQRFAATPHRLSEVPAGVDWPASGVFRIVVDDLAKPAQTVVQMRDRRVAMDRVPPGDVVSRGEALLTLRVSEMSDLPIAERVLQRSVFKPTDPLLARFNRRMSLPISLVLLRTPLTANQLSVGIVMLGVYAAWLFSRGTYVAGVAAAAVSLAASILDGCDGEIARLKYQESSFGCWVKTFGDYSYYIAIFAGMTLGAVRYTGSAVFYRIGELSLAGLLITFLLLIVLRQRITNGKPERLLAAAKAHFYGSGLTWAWLVAKVFCERDALDDAVWHPGVRARRILAGNRRSHGNRREHVLDQPRDSAAPPPEPGRTGATGGSSIASCSRFQFVRLPLSVLRRYGCIRLYALINYWRRGPTPAAN